MTIQNDFREVLLQVRASSDYSNLTDLLPYARKIGMRCQSLGDDALLFYPETAKTPVIRCCQHSTVVCWLVSWKCRQPFI